MDNQVEIITSFENKRIKNVALLQQKAKARNSQHAFVVEGIKMFEEAPRERVKEVYVSESFYKNESLRQKLAEGSYVVVKDDVFAKMCDTKTPQGIVCVVEMLDYDLKQIISDVAICKEEISSQKRNCKTYIILEDIQDPGNLGTILRSAEGAGVDLVIMSKNTVDVYNPKTIRSTMGSLYRVPFIYVEDLGKTIHEMKESDITVYAAHLMDSVWYDEINYPEKTAFVIGNEGNGLKDETAKLACAYIKIPMEGKLESLNAGVATSLLVYENYKQKRRYE